MKENKINLNKINIGIKKMDWKDICENGDIIEITVLLIKMLSELCIENIPKKNNVGNKRGISKEVKKTTKQN